ncbi:MAG: beta-propeller domain-containing protein [Candidatus Woesearchaeota archaeon]
MNKILSLYLVGILLFGGLVLIAGCSNNLQAPINPVNDGTSGDGAQLSGREIVQFNSTSELDVFLRNRMSDDGVSVYRGGVMMESDVRVMSATVAGAPSLDSKSSGASEYSQTNVQVEGVDEADFIKNDDKYIYLVQNNKLIIVDAMDQKEIISETDLPKNNYASNMFLYDGKVVVLAQSSDESFYFRRYDIAPQPSYESITNILIYDVSDRSNPELSEEFKVSGDYFQSRMKDGIVYLVAIKYASYPAMPPVIYAEKMISPNIYYFDNNEEQYNYNTIVSVDVVDESVVDSETYLLGYSNTLMMSEDNIYIAYQKQVFGCWGWYCRDDSYEKERFTEVVVPLLEGQLKSDIEDVLDMGLSDDEEWNKISEVLTSFYREIEDDEDLQEEYDSMLDDVAEALDEYDTKKLLENSKTIIHRVSVDDGVLSYEDSGEVDGRLLNQFSMDEYDGNLRVATTVDLWTNNGRKEYNNVYVLNSNLEVIGSIDGIAPDEQIYSTRFMGDKLYMVTFKQIDPFFVIDLSNPENPKILGKLKIPGYSSYLHPYNNNFIIGVGKDVGENDWGGVSTEGVKLSLFDVSDFENPLEVDKFEIGMAGSDSPILYEHKAFLLFNDYLVIPVSEVTSRNTGRYGYDYSYWDGAYVFKVSEDGFDLLGKVKHDSRINSYYSWWDRASVTRSMIMDDELFTISNKFIKVNDLSDDLKSLGSIDLPSDENYGPYYDVMPVDSGPIIVK